MRIIKLTAAFAVLLTGLLFGGRAAFGGSSGGAIQVFGTPASTGGGTVLITGAVGDSGTVASVNANSKPDPKGQYKLLSLQNGTILLNAKKLNQDSNNPNTPPTTFNSKTCSATAVFTDPVPVVSGTGNYAGIRGSVTITLTFAFLLPLTNGTCNLSGSGALLAQYGSIAGSGTVSF